MMHDADSPLLRFIASELPCTVDALWRDLAIMSANKLPMDGLPQTKRELTAELQALARGGLICLRDGVVSRKVREPERTLFV